ncbi:hypothetical protein, partial [uncultured Planococcus sp.]|uniref:hypothetical protein n=1 Tax=uncultured Planococcus sp. TaxID=337815 RepID=UPI00260B572D
SSSLFFHEEKSASTCGHSFMIFICQSDILKSAYETAKERRSAYVGFGVSVKINPQIKLYTPLYTLIITLYI